VREGKAMKKIVIPALLVVSAAFAPGLQYAVELPERACEIAQEVARPLFWHVWDKLLTHELERGMQPASSGGVASEWQQTLGNGTVVCIVFHVFLKHAFDGVVSVTEKNSSLLVSIPECPIRRTIGKGYSSFLATRLFEAGSKLLRRSS
jgi:hypothetical protein